MAEGDVTVPEGLTIPEGGAMTDAQKQFINQNFRGAMSEEHATHASLADYQDIDSFGKSFINAQKMVGADKLPMPQKDWGKEEWADFNKKIGMPVDPKGYELPTHESSTDADREWFESVAHDKLMLSKKQANDLWNEMNTRNAGVIEQFQTKNKNALVEGNKALREEWGVNYDKMVEATNKGLQRMDEDGRFRNWMKQTGLNQQPEMLRFANKVAQLFNEDQAPGDTRLPMPMSQEQIQGQINKIYSEAAADPKHPLMNKKDPAHNDIVKKLTGLTEKLQLEAI